MRTWQGVIMLAAVVFTAVATPAGAQDAGAPACPAAAGPSERGGDPAPVWSVKVTYDIKVPFNSCFYSGTCTDGWFGYTCASKSYCCPPTLTGDPPVAKMWQATVERNCTPQDDEFPDLGILILPGVGPDPAPHTSFGTAPSR